MMCLIFLFYWRSFSHLTPCCPQIKADSAKKAPEKPKTAGSQQQTPTRRATPKAASSDAAKATPVSSTPKAAAKPKPTPETKSATQNTDQTSAVVTNGTAEKTETVVLENSSTVETIITTTTSSESSGEVAVVSETISSSETSEAAPVQEKVGEVVQETTVISSNDIAVDIVAQPDAIPESTTQPPAQLPEPVKSEETAEQPSEQAEAPKATEATEIAEPVVEMAAVPEIAAKTEDASDEKKSNGAETAAKDALAKCAQSDSKTNGETTGPAGDRPAAGYTSEEEYKAVLAEKRRLAREAKEREAEMERKRLVSHCCLSLKFKPFLYSGNVFFFISYAVYSHLPLFSWSSFVLPISNLPIWIPQPKVSTNS